MGGMPVRTLSLIFYDEFVDEIPTLKASVFFARETAQVCRKQFLFHKTPNMSVK
jgi:hypothetical protein